LLRCSCCSQATAVFGQLRGLQPSDAKELSGVAELVFQKALHDPSYGGLYGQAIIQLGACYPRFLASAGCEDGGGGSAPGAGTLLQRSVSFAAEVVRSCQNEFDRFLYGEQQKLCDAGALVGGGTDGDGDSRDQELDDYLRQKGRALACVSIVGQLILAGVISARVLGQVVVELLRGPQCEPRSLPRGPSVECACELLNAVAGSRGWTSQAAPSSVHSLCCLAWLKDARVQDAARRRGALAHSLRI